MDQLPSIDTLIGATTNEQDKPTATQGAPATEPQKTDDSEARIKREQAHRREIYKAQQRIKELEGKQRDSSNQAGGIDINSKNPFKDMAKAKNMTQDDIVRLALEAMDDDKSDAEKKDDFSKMNPMQIAELVKKQLKEEQEKEFEEKSKTEANTKTYESIMTKVKETAASLIDKYPLVDGLGGHQAAIEQIGRVSCRERV